MDIDFDKLREGLRKLKGRDIIAAENEERAAGNNTAPMLAITASYQARLAAKALNVPYPELEELSAPVFQQMTTVVFTQLLGGSGSNETPPM